MRYGSVCSGIEAATVAWHPLGFEPVFFSEIEPFPSAVLAHHYPAVPNLGDFTQIGDKYRGAVDLIVGGTPCQSFSIAGKRAGMDDPRGNLAIEFIKLVSLTQPKWVIWENVPGVLSSWSDAEEEGWETNDFDTFLSLLGECGYGFAWRILDAQYFGVPQLRRRVFVVGHLGVWQPAATVLFERESLRQHSKASRETGKDVAATLKGSTGKRGFPLDFESGLVVRTLDEVAYSITFSDANGTRKDRPNGGLYVNQTDKSSTLAAKAPGYETAVVNAIAFTERTRDGGRQLEYQEDVAYTLLNPGDGGRSQDRCIAVGGKVPYARRLTPLECERLQGFPDNYTNIMFRGRSVADNPRYQALGNSMAVPVMRWIGRRVQMVDEILGSAA